MLALQIAHLARRHAHQAGFDLFDLDRYAPRADRVWVIHPARPETTSDLQLRGPTHR